MCESAAGIGKSPDYLAVVHALEDRIVVIEIAIKIAAFYYCYSLQRLVVTLSIEHSPREQGCSSIAVHPSGGRCRLRQILNGKTGIPFDGIPTLPESVALCILGGDGHLIQSIVEDDTESVLD